MTRNEELFNEMMVRSRRMWSAFARRQRAVDDRVRRDTSTQRIRFEHLSSDPAEREQQIQNLVLDAQDSDKTSGGYLAAFDRYNRAALAYGAALQVEQNKRIIELLSRLTEGQRAGSSL